MYMKHDKFTEEEIDIINRGKEGDLRNLEEMNFYFHYLNIFKDEYLEELYKKYRKEIFDFEYIGGLCLTAVPVGVGGIVCLFGGNFPLAVLSFSLVAAAIIVPYKISSSSAKNKYKGELQELSHLIKKETERVRKEKELEDKKRMENSKKDGFILNIVNDIKTVLSSKYEGYQKEILALKTLGYKYLKLKDLMKTTSSSEILTMYPQFNTIIWSIEEEITKNVKFKEIQDLDLHELESVLVDLNEKDNGALMSLEDLMNYIPKKDPKLELRAFPSF